MTRLALMLALCGCAKHPVIFVTTAAAAVAGFSCEIDDGTSKTCAITTGIVALALGGLTALVTHFADTTAHLLPPDEEITPAGRIRLHTQTAPPPVPLDGRVCPDGSTAGGRCGSIDAGVADAPADAPAADAVISPPDA